jgi:transcriptional regulator with XRE-family HTH domain
MNHYQNFGVWLRKAREEAGVSQGALAVALGVKQPVISRMENGLKSKISRDEANLIAQTLRIPIDDVYEAAGITSANSTEISALAVELSQLDADDQQYILNLIRRLSASRGQQSAEPAPTEQQ